MKQNRRNIEVVSGKHRKTMWKELSRRTTPKQTAAQFTTGAHKHGNGENKHN